MMEPRPITVNFLSLDCDAIVRVLNGDGPSLNLIPTFSVIRSISAARNPAKSSMYYCVAILWFVFVVFWGNQSVLLRKQLNCGVMNMMVSERFWVRNSITSEVRISLNCLSKGYFFSSLMKCFKVINHQSNYVIKDGLLHMFDIHIKVINNHQSNDVIRDGHLLIFDMHEKWFISTLRLLLYSRFMMPDLTVFGFLI